MKKHFLLALGFLIVSTGSVLGQKLENSNLWKISGNGLEQPSYLFGTMHILCDATLSNKVKKALDETSQLVLELDMDDPEMQSQMVKSMFMSDNKTLKDFVDDKEYQLIDSLFIKNLGMSVKMMERVKPFFLSASFYPTLLDCPIESIEEELMKIAKEQKEEVIGLETFQFQLKVFDEIPYKEQVKDLVRSAKDNLASDKANTIKMMQVYKDEDINGLLKMISDDTDSYMSKNMDKLLDDRNKNWIPKIKALSKEKPTFFGVGAGHLAGENGVIKLLRKAGYTVTPVM
ncbi:TraB/GumN family protein [Pseudotenacibaculum sp. MALMAid0570]|uniref:TraB/GumN family protein n=1 Tax=Pseudotenacibaculum sp. MALMAid0570 TaxID=3143938 RepID=UPI0032DE3ED9